MKHPRLIKSLGPVVLWQLDHYSYQITGRSQAQDGTRLSVWADHDISCAEALTVLRQLAAISGRRRREVA